MNKVFITLSNLCYIFQIMLDELEDELLLLDEVSRKENFTMENFTLENITMEENGNLSAIQVIF